MSDICLPNLNLLRVFRLNIFLYKIYKN